ncbi:hypothetical protein [Streptomyces sp. LN500]|uniref:hypothetical protein n=1 Tax=Streptomyces sp. LN500 TaxID=3112978 RepID=UPI00371004FA
MAADESACTPGRQSAGASQPAVDDLDAPGVADRSEHQLLARSRATTVTVTPWARFMMIGAATSVIAIETALADRYGKGTLVGHLGNARADGLLTEEQYDLLDSCGRPIRNRYAHGDLTHAVLTPPLAIGMVRTSITILAELHATPRPGITAASE